LTPLSELSSAFLTAKSPLDVQFAYFESALAVRFLIERHGREALNRVLDELGAGLQINDALARHTMSSLEQLDQEFAVYAMEYAKHVAPKATWETPDAEAVTDLGSALSWLNEHPDSVPGLTRLAVEMVRAEQWNEAVAPLEKLRTLFPESIGAESPYAMLAKAYRELGKGPEERAVLEDWAARDGDALPAQLRLMELSEARGEWATVAKYAREALAVNPLTAAPHRYLAKAAEQLGERGEAIEAYRALVILDPTDPAEQHFRLARMLKEDGHAKEARRAALKALEAAPRYRAAHALLLELGPSESGGEANVTPTTEGTTP
jgi:predicted Zn-dependent protease